MACDVSTAQTVLLGLVSGIREWPTGLLEGAGP